MSRNSRHSLYNLLSMDRVRRHRHWAILMISFLVIFLVVINYCQLGPLDDDRWELPKLILTLLVGVVAYFEYLQANKESRTAQLLELHERFIDTK